MAYGIVPRSDDQGHTTAVRVMTDAQNISLQKIPQLERDVSGIRDAWYLSDCAWVTEKVTKAGFIRRKLQPVCHLMHMMQLLTLDMQGRGHDSPHDFQTMISFARLADTDQHTIK